MQTQDYLKLLVEEIHSAALATLDDEGRPQTRIIDMMLWDERGVYFLTAKGKAFYRQLMKQGYVALSATKDKVSVSLRGRIRNIHAEKLDEIFNRNPYMKAIYPGDTRTALEVFWLYEAEGEYFDIRDPSHVTRDSFAIGCPNQKPVGYFITQRCTGCGKCLTVCPQKCIDIAQTPAIIDAKRCLHCGRCAERCEIRAVEMRG